LANYSDGLTDLPLPTYVNHFLERGKIACFLSVRPPQSYHIISAEEDLVQQVRPISKAGIWINGGFFVFRSEIFKYIKEGEELVEEPFERLIWERQLMAYKYEGYWCCMDTFKDRQQLEELYTRREAPWEVWRSRNGAPEGARRKECRHTN